MHDTGLVYVGKIVELEKIPDAHFIVSATVVCGAGGKWKAVVRKDDFSLGCKCIVYLPDSLIPECDKMRFMEKNGWRVKMQRYRGAPSEVVVMPMPTLDHPAGACDVGDDVTDFYGVTKYFKPIPSNLQGLVKGQFPSFIPKTDEPNYQSNYELVEALHGRYYYITEKADGSSTTAYRYKGQFGVCSRNYELEYDEKNGYWQVAHKYNLQERLPEGIALQWETCGPKIQSNRMGLKEVDGFAFSAYDIREKRYFTLFEMILLCKMIEFPMVKLLSVGSDFDKEKVHLLGEGKYANGSEREGVVVRSQANFVHAPISFKVINLNYEK
jgi:RNA ligase (TIGR02306 family)